MNDKTEQYKSCGDKTRIVIAGGYPTVRRGLIQLISQEAKLGVCVEAENANQALDAIRKQQVDLAIVDISLKNTNGVQLAEKIKLQYPNLPVLILSMHDEALYVEHTLRAGAKQNLVNKQATEQITKAVCYAQSLLRSRIYGFSVLVQIGGNAER